MKLIQRFRVRRDEVGAAAVVIALFFSFVALPLGAVGVDFARLYVELERVQAAADAAATAGVTYMPDNFAAARARALEVAEDNGFPNTGSTRVAVTTGEKPTQLEVTVSSTVENSFGRSFGVPTSTMSRSAVADFNGPAPMGSPCNVFGNEPAASTSVTGYGPAGSVIKVPTHANCANPQFWGAMSGPETVKDQGSQFETRKCEGGEDGCASGSAGAANTDFDPRGYIYLVRVNQAGVGKSVRLQIYDPAYVETSSDCNYGPVASTMNGTTEEWRSNNNISSSNNFRYPYATSDADKRYDNANDATTMFCAGDSDNAGKRFPDLNRPTTAGEVPTITSFALRSPSADLNPFSSTAYNPAQCTKQFPGYSVAANGSYSRSGYTYYTRSSGTAERNLRNSGTGPSSSYNVDLARVFHQWVDLCTFTPTQAGDYYLQVRTNVALPASYTLDSTGAVAGNSAVVNQAGDDINVKGNGTNNFAFRAVTTADAGAISVAPFEKMRIYANADSANTTFNLVRVVPAAANKTLVLSYFDVGEATGTTAGTVQILPPGDAKLGTAAMTSIANCQASGVYTGSLTNCKVNNVTYTTNNGKLQTIRIPIPSNYTCQIASQGGCWFRVAINFPGAEVHDATTWTARIVGEPVRLIE